MYESRPDRTASPSMVSLKEPCEALRQPEDRSAGDMAASVLDHVLFVSFSARDMAHAALTNPIWLNAWG